MPISRSGVVHANHPLIWSCERERNERIKKHSRLSFALRPRAHLATRASARATNHPRPPPPTRLRLRNRHLAHPPETPPTSPDQLHNLDRIRRHLGNQQNLERPRKPGGTGS